MTKGFMHYDLIIIGMGLSGLMAAKTAAEMGKKILIVGKGIGSLCLFSNTIDVLGTVPNTMKISDGVSQWAKDHPKHPYAKLGWKEIEKALSSFTSLFQSPYSFQTMDDGNYLIPTGAGTLRPTYLIPSTMVAGNSPKEAKTLVVGLRGLKDFYAGYVAARLGWRGVTLPLPETSHQEITGTAISRLMEQVRFREAIGREMKKRLNGEIRVGLPAILGTRDPIRVKEDLERITETAVFEIPTLPPSIPGTRIFNRFKEHLVKKGVTFLLGHPVLKAILQGKRCEEIQVFNPPIHNSYAADRYILATGRFIGGGLIAGKEKIFEPIFNLPVTQPDSREEWFAKSFFNERPHPIHEAGILTDSFLRPTDEKRELLLENVWIAGSILSGHHSIDEKSREGIEIATGYRAAKLALGT